jgi:aminobenzoyl-glutamate utilization protein B
MKGMIVAAKSMALAAAELFASPAIVSAAKAELTAKRGPGFRYETVLGDRKPPLDYRAGSVP